MPIEFKKGLQEVGDGVWAYLQPSGSWGYSNAGLVGGHDAALLVDTLFDLRLTQEMLDEMKPITGTRPIESLVNTHGNGDHCYGNSLVPERAKIYATQTAVEEMREIPAQALHDLQSTEDDEVRAFAQHAFGSFDLAEVGEFREPDHTFSERLSLAVGGRDVEVTDLGAAHSHSDSIVYVPSARIVFTGDLVFAEGTPVSWAGPLDNWFDACDRICSLDVDLVVPGHGPITDSEGVRAIARYFAYVREEATARQEAGMDSVEAAFDIDLGEFADLGDSERILANVEVVYRELDPDHAPVDALSLFGLMGRYRRGAGPR